MSISSLASKWRNHFNRERFIVVCCAMLQARFSNHSPWSDLALKPATTRSLVTDLLPQFKAPSSNWEDGSVHQIDCQVNVPRIGLHVLSRAWGTWKVIKSVFGIKGWTQRFTGFLVFSFLAQQEAQRAQFLVEKAKQEQKQKIVQAEGEATAAKMISLACCGEKSRYVWPALVTC